MKILSIDMKDSNEDGSLRMITIEFLVGDYDGEYVTGSLHFPMNFELICSNEFEFRSKIEDLAKSKLKEFLSRRID